MSGKASKSYPGLALGIEDVTGELIVDTGLKQVAAFTVCLAQEPVAAEADAHGELEPLVAGATQKLKLFVKAADGTTAGIAEAKVSWTAHEQ